MQSFVRDAQTQRIGQLVRTNSLSAISEALDMSYKDCQDLVEGRGGEIAESFHTIWNVYYEGFSRRAGEGTRQSPRRSEPLLTIISHLQCGFRRTLENQVPAPGERESTWNVRDWDAFFLWAVVELLWNNAVGPAQLASLTEAETCVVAWAIKKNRTNAEAQRRRRDARRAGGARPTELESWRGLLRMDQ
jgi:hypothetical protein